MYSNRREKRSVSLFIRTEYYNGVRCSCLDTTQNVGYLPEIIVEIRDAKPTFVFKLKLMIEFFLQFLKNRNNLPTFR